MTVSGPTRHWIIATILIGLLAALLALPARADAQSRNAQVTTGAGLAALGVYAAFGDRGCPYKTPSTIVLERRCYQAVLNGVPYEWDLGDPLELPVSQVAGGLVVASLGGLMAGGLWSPSGLDALTAIGLGVALVGGAFDYSDAPGTINVDFGEQRFKTCQRGNTITDKCVDAALARKHMLVAGLGALGLGLAHWLWSPDVQLDLTPGGVRAAKTITW